jgi:pimeloyl-ACP methyl ester carboxylesterase
MLKKLLPMIILLLSIVNLQAFTQNPNQSVTIYVHGFDPSGYKKSGVFGTDEVESFFNDIPTFLGLPTIANQEDKNKPNVVSSTTYYGDTAPEYYTKLDEQEVADKAEGIPRYALILAKYAKHLLQRTGAKQVNFISGSMGALVTRYMIEKDLENLASTKKIARWMTIEGVLNGNYAASKSKLFKIIDYVDDFSIDTEHMKYKWIESQFNAPRSLGQSPYYKDILIGHESSTKDDAKEHALTWLMLSRGQFQPNDGYQALSDTYFYNILEPYRFYGQNPTHSFLHENHLGVKHRRP